ncbi:MAG: ferrous iron transport protein A, partial [Microbacterium sp.]|nr:ferrous iron transport protein A [Microbacterium sp.]
VQLGQAPRGHRGRVLRVSDRDPGLLRALEDAGVRIGREVRVVDPLTLMFETAEAVALPEAALDAVWLTA